jgi:hypothetical protein
MYWYMYLAFKERWRPHTRVCDWPGLHLTSPRPCLHSFKSIYLSRTFQVISQMFLSASDLNNFPLNFQRDLCWYITLYRLIRRWCLVLISDSDNNARVLRHVVWLTVIPKDQNCSGDSIIWFRVFPPEFPVGIRILTQCTQTFSCCFRYCGDRHV